MYIIIAIMQTSVSPVPSLFSSLFPQAVDLINPSPKTKFEHVCVNQQEAIYNSNQKAPLGSSHNQSPGLPSGLNPLSTSFGLKTIRTESAGDMVNPQKTASEVEHEYIAGRDLYKKVKAIIISYLGCSVCVISTFRNCIIYSSQSLLALTIIVPTIYLPCNNSDWQGKVPKLAGRETYVSNLSFTSLNLLSYPSLTQYSALFRMSI